MNVHLTFDVEIWCNGWAELDARFPAAFERYVYGRSSKGEYALPKTLEVLQRHGLRGVFFVEPLFAARFGRQYLETIVQMIEAAGQDVQLHLHTEWTDEIRPPIIADISAKRQHLTRYSRQEQSELIGFGKRLLQSVTRGAVTAFRAGSYAANADTYAALRDNGIVADSSLNEVAAESGADLVASARTMVCGDVDGIASYPVTVFRDGFGRLRPAQVGACSFSEMRDALTDAQLRGQSHFVIVSHNFEMLRSGSSEPDGIVAGRFADLCAFLAEGRDRFHVGGYPTTAPSPQALPLRPRAGAAATLRRHVEQTLRRLR